MKKQRFIALVGCLMLAKPISAHAQQPKTPVIGILMPSSRVPNVIPPPPTQTTDAIHQALREQGFVEGQNVTIDYLFADGHYDRLPALASELVSRRVDVIVTNSTPSALAVKDATTTIPIVFTSVGDPIGSGLVTSLAHPGGNVTGFSNFNVALVPKVLELMSDLVPGLNAVALLVNPRNPYSGLVIRTVREAAATKRLEITVEAASTEGEIGAAFIDLSSKQVGALIVEGDPFFSSRREQIVPLAARSAVPTIYLHLAFAQSGGLIVYGVDENDTYRRAMDYAGRILKGDKAADLPVQLPDRFRLIVNLSAAKALGLSVPQSILASADEVIE